jgi:hypothetical protein
MTSAWYRADFFPILRTRARSSESAAAIGQKGRYVSVVETVVNLTEDRNETKKPNESWSEW